jgi:hypothetical protein
VINNSRLLFDEFAGGKDSEVGDTSYGVPCGELLVFIGVDLENYGVAGHFPCGARDLRCSSATGAAPICPEVDEDRNARALDDFVEECSVNLKRLIKRRERSFARPASASIRQMARGETVFLTTLLAGPYRRHLVTPNQLRIRLLL